MTLSRFLRDYIYIPLGGSKSGEFKTLRNLVLTFLIGGIWHGAGWTFIMWGALHGIALIIHRVWNRYNIKMPKVFAWFLTFMFVNITWVFFRAVSFQDAWDLLGAMFLSEPGNLTVITSFFSLPILLIGIFLLFLPNTNIKLDTFQPSYKNMIVLSTMIFLGFIYLNSVVSSEFLYFDF
jgi:D-alanyl-lipoteichoic acid acyltransferase DltB (MBOAT superfamily)